MIYLMQIYKMLNKRQKKQFIKHFSNFRKSVEKLEGHDLNNILNDRLIIHFGIELTEEKQLNRLTEYLLNKDDLNFLSIIPQLR